jgi:transposase
MAITQVRRYPPAKAYYQRKRGEGKTHKEALRCLKRRLSNVVYRQLQAETDQSQADPGGHSGAALSSRAAG